MLRGYVFCALFVILARVQAIIDTSRSACKGIHCQEESLSTTTQSTKHEQSSMPSWFLLPFIIACLIDYLTMVAAQGGRIQANRSAKRRRFASVCCSKTIGIRQLLRRPSKMPRCYTFCEGNDESMKKVWVGDE